MALRNDPGRRFLVQVSSRDADLLRQRLQAIDADPRILERCIDPDAISGIFSYERMFALQLPVAEDWISSQHEKITLLCLPNTLAIISEDFLFSGDGFLPDELLLSVYRQTYMADMLFVLLDGLIDHASHLTMKARRAVDRMEDNMLDKSDIPSDQLLDFRRAIAHFEFALEAKHRTLTALLSTEASPIELSAIREPLRDVIAHVEHSQHYVERIEDRLSELHHHVTLMLQDRTNQRLRVLTILSAISMPLTFVAGIYGMNFRNMPELGWKYGYPLTLIVMLGAAIGLLWYFARKGWFK